MIPTIRIWAAAALALAFVQVVHAQKEEFDTEKMINDLEAQLRLKQEEYEKLKPELEQALSAKSQELKQSINEAVDEGFVELQAMGKELSAATDRAQAQLEAALNSQQMQELRDYLNKLDKQAIEQARQELVDELTRLMELSQEQLDKIKPVLEETLRKQSELLREFVADAGRSFEEFRKEYEALGEETRRKLQEFLDSEQMDRLEKRLEEIGESIRGKVFQET